MPTAIEQTNTVNIQYSLNAHMRTALAAITKPSWLASYTYATNNPEATASLPAISVNHIPVSMRDLWQGRAVGNGKTGMKYSALMEVNCWVSRSSTNWNAQLRTLQDMVLTVLGNTKQVVILDFVGDQESPTATGYLVRTGDAEIVNTAPDPNPDIERRRILISYWLVYRS